MLQAVLPLLLQERQPLVLLSPQTLQVLQVNAPHLSRLTLRLQQVTLQILQHKQTGSDTPGVAASTCSAAGSRRAVHLGDADQGVQLPVKRLAEHRDVFLQLGGSSLTQNRPPAFVQLQQVHRRVLLLLLQLVLIQRGNIERVRWTMISSCSLTRFKH